MSYEAPVTFIISPYLMLLVALLASCKVEDKQAKEEAEQQAIRAEMQGKLDEIAKTFKQRYNADSTWRDALKGKPISTYALQKELIRSDERPVFAGGTLFDIEKRGKGVTLIFSVSGFGESTLRQEFLLMELKCPLLAEREVERLKVGEFSPWDADPDTVAVSTDTSGPTLEASPTVPILLSLTTVESARLRVSPRTN